MRKDFYEVRPVYGNMANGERLDFADVEILISDDFFDWDLMECNAPEEALEVSLKELGRFFK